MDSSELKELAVAALEELKGKDIECLEVAGMTSIADWMIVVTGTSNRHVKAMADEVVKKAREAGHPIRGAEGEAQAEWVLLDLGDVIVHVMQQAARQLYDLESLWGLGTSRPSEA